MVHDALLHVNCIHHLYGFGFSLIHWSAMCAFIPYSIAYVRMYSCPLYILMCYNKASILLLLISYSFILFPLLQYIYNCYKWIKPQAMVPFVRVTWVICCRILFDLIVLTISISVWRQRVYFSMLKIPNVNINTLELINSLKLYLTKAIMEAYC